MRRFNVHQVMSQEYVFCKNMIPSHSTKRRKLESSYETICIDYKKRGLYDRHYCIEECMSCNVWKVFRKVSLFFPVTELQNTSQCL